MDINKNKKARYVTNSEAGPSSVVSGMVAIRTKGNPRFDLLMDVLFIKCVRTRNDIIDDIMWNNEGFHSIQANYYSVLDAFESRIKSSSRGAGRICLTDLRLRMKKGVRVKGQNRSIFKSGHTGNEDQSVIILPTIEGTVRLFDRVKLCIVEKKGTVKKIDHFPDLEKAMLRSIVLDFICYTQSSLQSMVYQWIKYCGELAEECGDICLEWKSNGLTDADIDNMNERFTRFVTEGNALVNSMIQNCKTAIADLVTDGLMKHIENMLGDTCARDNLSAYARYRGWKLCVKDEKQHLSELRHEEKRPDIVNDQLSEVTVKMDISSHEEVVYDRSFEV